MAANSPWSVKGVDPEARQAAKLAARKAGLTLGAWLAQTIRSAASDQLRHGAGRTVEAAEGDAQAASASAPEPVGSAVAPTLEAIHRNLQRLAARIDETEARAAEALAPLAARLERLSSDVEALQAAPSSAATADALAPVVARLEGLSDQVDTLRAHASTDEIDIAETVAPLVEAMSLLSQEVDRLKEASQAQPSSIQLRKLQEQLDRIMEERLSQTHQPAPAAAGGTVERTVIRLAERLQRLEESLEEPRRKSLFGLGR